LEQQQQHVVSRHFYLIAVIKKQIETATFGLFCSSCTPNSSAALKADEIPRKRGKQKNIFIANLVAVLCITNVQKVL